MKEHQESGILSAIYFTAAFGEELKVLFIGLGLIFGVLAFFERRKGL